MSAKKKDAFSEIIVGIFMLAVLSLLVYFTVVISGVDLIHGRRKVFARVTFRDVGGLKDHDSIMYRGTKVGSVDKIELTPSNLVVVAEIDGDVVLRDSYRIAVCNLSMLGGNYLLLEEGKGEQLPLETTNFLGEDPTDWMRDVSQIAKNLNEFTSGPELKTIVTNLQAASIAIRDVADRVARGEGFVGKMLAPENTLYDDCASVANDMKELASRLKNGEGTLGKILSKDDTLYTNLLASVESANVIATRLKNGEGFIGRLLAKDDQVYTNVTEAIASFRNACDSLDAKETIASANNLLESLNVVATRLKEGEGTMGKLLANDELYSEINGLTKDVRQVLDNFRDTTPITTFGSLIMGGL